MFSFQDGSYFFYDRIRRTCVMYVKIPSTDNDPYVHHLRYCPMPDIRKSYKMVILHEENREIPDFEIFEKKIKEDYFCNPYNGGTSYTL